MVPHCSSTSSSHLPLPHTSGDFHDTNPTFFFKAHLQKLNLLCSYFTFLSQCFPVNADLHLTMSSKPHTRCPPPPPHTHTLLSSLYLKFCMTLSTSITVTCSHIAFASPPRAEHLTHTRQTDRIIDIFSNRDCIYSGTCSLGPKEQV